MHPPEFWSDVERLFDELVELPEHARRDRLEALGDDKAELRREVASLLEQASFEGTHLQSAIRHAAAQTAVGDTGLESGTRVDVYRIERRLGSGGMGEVYAAEQFAPVRRTVALKLVRLGMDSPQVLARFESERQALALMDHPSIATVFDAGTTETGRPYFVMELVEGETVDHYCDSRSLSVEERLRLVVAVCRGVHHAHQKGIIHRDLKPANILVTEIDGEPVPKVIDFGIAKAVEGRLGEESVNTRVDQLIGTPAYMSPEQAGSLGADVDIRSDVFSLGALLYELLVGRRHLELDEADFESFLRGLRETEAIAPSQRLASLSEEAEGLAARRSQTTLGLQRRLRGDLDWIVLRALEKDRDRRYVSAAQLADDIERHLRDEPVLASPPSRSYRFGKLVRRHRVATAAATVATLSLLGGAAVATLGLLQARDAQRAAVEEAATAEKVSDFLVGLFAASDPNTDRRAEATARELLDVGAQQLEAGLGDQPVVRARLANTMGRVYESLGLFGEARPHLEEAAAVYRSMPGRELELAEVLDTLSTVLYRIQSDGAGAAAVEALEIRRRILGEDDLLLSSSWKKVATSRLLEGDYEGAEQAFGRALQIAEMYPEQTAILSDRLQSMAGILDIRARAQEALPYVERAIAVFEPGADPDDPWLGHLYDGLAIVRTHTGDFPGAEPAFRRSLEQRQRTLGERHHTTGESWGNLGELYLKLERWDEARDVFEKAIDILSEAYDPEHLRVINYMDQLAVAQAALGDLGQARETLLGSMAIRDRTLPPDHPDSGLSRQVLGGVELDAANFARASELLAQAWQRRSPVVGETHPEMLDLAGARARAAAGAGLTQEAARLYERAVVLYEQAGKLDSPEAGAVVREYRELLEGQ